MASSKEYLQFVLGQLSDLDEITYRAMMGEFIIYYSCYMWLMCLFSWKVET